jgi:DNA invertase Pin-like site-specific DNA recombinase
MGRAIQTGGFDMNAIKEFRNRLRGEIITLLKEGELTYEQIAQHCSCTVSTVYTVAKENKLRRSDRVTEQVSGQEN